MKISRVPAVAIFALSVSVSVAAHHSWPVSMDKLVTVKGTVQKIEWTNPHPMFTVDVRADDGKRESWLIGVVPRSTGWKPMAGRRQRSSRVTW